MPTKRAAKKAAGKRRTRAEFVPAGRHDPMSRDERMSIVFEYFRQGKNSEEIRTLAKREHDLLLNREDAWRLISEAARTGRLAYLGPEIEPMARDIARRHRWLQDARVVQTRVPADLSLRAAETLLTMIRNRALAHSGPSACVVRIGVSGGNLVQLACKQLAALLMRDDSGLPTELIFHNLVSSLDVSPDRDITGIFSYFQGLRESGLKVNFVSIPAPGLVTTGQYDALRGMDSIQKALGLPPAQPFQLDIVVSSIGHWNVTRGKPDSALADYLSQRGWLDTFVNAGAIGDYIFTPVGAAGFVEVPDFRIMSLFKNTAELNGWIERGTDVLAIAGPCGTCGQPKSEVLKALLEAPRERRLLTHLICDHRTARDVLR